MRVEWAGEQVEFEAATTGQWYRWLVGVVVPILRGDQTGWTHEAMRILLEIVPAKLLNAHCETHSVIDLGNSILNASSLEQSGVQAFFDAAFRANEFDPSEPDGPCQCRECRGMIERDDLCLFRQPPIDDAARHLASVNADLLAKFWALPLSAYQLAKARDSAQARGQMAREQDRKRKETRREIRDELLSKHGIH